MTSVIFAAAAPYMTHEKEDTDIWAPLEWKVEPTPVTLLELHKLSLQMRVAAKLLGVI